MNFYEHKKLDSDLNNFWVLCYMPEVNFKCKPNQFNTFRVSNIKKTRLVHAYFYER